MKIMDLVLTGRENSKRELRYDLKYRGSGAMNLTVTEALHMVALIISGASPTDVSHDARRNQLHLYWRTATATN